jgi:hemoglobin-like flavoprotein
LITFVVHKLNHLDEIISDVRALGQRHKKYQVQSEHYATVCTALLWTLENQLGTSWDHETRDAWSAIYQVLSATMIGAGESDHIGG